MFNWCWGCWMIQYINCLIKHFIKGTLIWVFFATLRVLVNNIFISLNTKSLNLVVHLCVHIGSHWVQPFCLLKKGVATKEYLYWLSNNSLYSNVIDSVSWLTALNFIKIAWLWSWVWLIIMKTDTNVSKSADFLSIAQTHYMSSLNHHRWEWSHRYKCRLQLCLQPLHQCLES